MTRQRAAREGTSARSSSNDSTSGTGLLPLPLGLSRAWMARWLEVFERTGSPSAASASVKLDRSTPFKAAETDKVFAAAWEERRYAGVDLLEQTARQRAIDGWLEPVFHEGSVCGHKRKFSDRLLEALMRGRNPAVFNRSAGDTGGEVQPRDTALEIRQALESMRASYDGPPEPPPPTPEPRGPPAEEETRAA